MLSDRQNFLFLQEIRKTISVLFWHCLPKIHHISISGLLDLISKKWVTCYLAKGDNFQNLKPIRPLLPTYGTYCE